MHTYKFNITLEGYDDFFFEVDILPSHTFLDFHHILQSVLQFSGTELASFYVSNSNWKKKTEISLIDMNIGNDGDLYEDDDENKPRKKKTLIMEKTKLAQIIEDPHQRFIYIYDFLTPWTLYVELVKIFDNPRKMDLPVCSKISGELPTKKTHIQLKKGAGDEEGIEDLDADLPEDEASEDEGFEGMNDDDAALDEGFDELKF